jgi:hypothetical protein
MCADIVENFVVYDVTIFDQLVNAQNGVVTFYNVSKTLGDVIILNFESILSGNSS